LEFISMNVRHWIGDVGLAVLLALPTAALAAPSAIIWQARSPAAETPAPSTKAAEQAFLPSRFDFPD
jgi:hypothetical protein